MRTYGSRVLFLFFYFYSYLTAMCNRMVMTDLSPFPLPINAEIALFSLFPHVVFVVVHD